MEIRIKHGKKRIHLLLLVRAHVIGPLEGLVGLGVVLTLGGATSRSNVH
jgi:hypothetical protein